MSNNQACRENGSMKTEEDVFLNQFDEQGRMRILDGMRYYKKTDTQNNMPRFVITMTDSVDKECLQYAAEMALKRFRVHSFVVVQDQQRFYLKQNTRKPVVHYDDGKRYIVCTEENHDYMTRIGYNGCNISVEIFHGVTDGRGTMPFLSTLLYYYCEKRYGGVNPDMSGIILVDTPEDPREYADSMLFLPEEQIRPGKQYVYDRAFQFPDEQMESECACKCYELKVDGAQFDEYVVSNGSCRSAVFTSFMNQAIAGYCTTRQIQQTPIVAAMAVDARRAYGAEQTMQCCVGTIPLWYDEEIGSLPIAEQLKRTKQMVKDGTRPENILARALGTKRFNELMEEKFPTLEEKKEFCRQKNKEGGVKYTYGISYVGEVMFGEGIDEHVADVSSNLCANTIPIIIEIMKFKGQYHISYCTHMAEDRYVRKFQEMFLAVGIECTCVQKEDYVETVADF